MMAAALALAVPALRGLPLGSDTTDLSAQLTSIFGTSAQVWMVGLVFLRMASVVMLIPGLGDQAVPPQLRIGFSLLLAIIIAPLVHDYLPPVPVSIGDLVGQVLHEVIVGLILGTLMRVMIFTLLITGEVMSLQTGLSFSQTANPAEAQPSTSLGTFLSLLGLVLIWATNMHHLFIRAMADSYAVFSPVKAIMLNDAATMMVQTMGKSFMLAMQLSAPLIVFGLVFNIATGFVGRIMPNFPVFFAATPLSLLFGLSLFALGLGATGMIFIDHYQDVLSIFIRSR